MTSWLIPEWLLALALTLFVIDIFADEGWISWGGVLAVAGWATWRIDAPLKWSVLVFILATLSIGALWQWLFRSLVGQCVRRLVQRGAPDEVISEICGAKGSLRIVEGRVMFRWRGDELWPVANPPPGAADGQCAKARGLKDGEVVLA